MSRTRSDTSFTLLAGALVLLLAVAAMLFVFLMRAPVDKAAQSLSVAHPVACPKGSHTPVCYQFVLTNVGTAAGQFGCRAHPADGSSSVFTNGSSTYVTPVDVPLEANQDLTLMVLAEPLKGHGVVGVPQVICDPIP